ncbi:hypothetical protein [Streptomyces sp. NPDC054863]
MPLRALSRRPAVILVEGEAGIGKPRLVGEALARLPNGGPHTLADFCPPLPELAARGADLGTLSAAAPVR